MSTLVEKYRGKSIGRNTVISIASEIESSGAIIDAFEQCLNVQFVYDPRLEAVVNAAKEASSHLIRALKSGRDVDCAVDDLKYVIDDIKYLSNNQIEELYDS